MKPTANNWYKELAKFQLRKESTRSRNNDCLFARAEAEGHTFIFFCVDDFILASTRITLISDVKRALKAKHKTVYEAKRVDIWDQWHRAMKDEVKALQDNETWNLVRPPTERDVIPGKWVYKVKLVPSGQVDKYKARYLAKGFKQVEAMDYIETFAATCKPETFRILLKLSAKQGYVMHQFDVKAAFLHSPIEEEVYLEQPQEFVEKGSNEEKLVCRLNKSIYGLKQAANNWFRELANFLLRHGFTRSRNDHCCSQEQRQRVTPSPWSGLMAS